VRNRLTLACLALATAAAMPTAGWAQFKEADPGGSKLGESQTQYWQCGVTVEALGGPCRGIVGYVPVPVEWPEQTVKIVDEQIDAPAKVTYQTVDDTVKLMVVRIPQLAGGQEAKALVTFEIRRSVILAPDETDQYQLPDSRKLGRSLAVYLGESPKIEARHPRMRALAREIGADKDKAWEKVEAIYDWVRDNVEYKNGPLKGALAALDDKTGDCEELTSLFIAICRAAGIPARTVWVPGHCYPEFYLVDQQGNGHWFPCQAAGSRAFGEMPEYRPILQKGDNFRPPWNTRDRQRYLAEYLTGTPVPGGGKPRVRFVREIVAR
jgi:transglutaminase-like putative cysteine protease